MTTALPSRPIPLSSIRRAVLPPARERRRVSLVCPGGPQQGVSNPLASLQGPLQPLHQWRGVLKTQPAVLQTSTESPLKTQTPGRGI